MQTMTDKLRRALADAGPLQHAATLQVAMLQAAGYQRPKIMDTLAIDLREYMLCCYRIRAITKDWLR